MPFTPQELASARSIVHDATSEADFKSKANASVVKWWNANEADKTTLLAETQRPDVRSGVSTYCRQLGFSSAYDYLLKNVNAQHEKGRGYWLKYYLLEVHNPGDRHTGIDLVNALLAYTGPQGLNLEFKHGSIDDVPVPQFLDVLQKLLAWGFDKIPLDCEGNQTGGGDLAHLADCVRTLNGTESYKGGWRSDSRSYQEIVDAAGFQAKARSEDYAKSHDMREPWHPMSDPAQRKYMWFRKSQKDNCLYTLVSIGGDAGDDSAEPDFKAYLPFPLLCDHPELVRPTKVFCQVGTGKAWTWLELGVSSCWLYLFVASNLVVFDTAKAQQLQGKKPQADKDSDSFPEKGVAGIPLENIYGAIRFIRIHHGTVPRIGVPTPTEGKALDIAGFTAMPVEVRLCTQHSFSRRMMWGNEGKNKVGEFFDHASIAKLTSVRWKTTGYTDISPTFNLPPTFPSHGGEEVKLSALSFKELR